MKTAAPALNAFTERLRQINTLKLLSVKYLEGRISNFQEHNAQRSKLSVYQQCAKRPHLM